MTTFVAFILLALRNVSRNRARSAITLGAIFFGVAMTIVLAGFGNGLTKLMVDDVVNGKLGAIQVHRTGFAADNQNLDLDMSEKDGVAERMSSVAGVIAVAPRLTFSGLVSNGTIGTMFIGRGIDPEREYAALPWSTRSVTGQPVSADVAAGAVLGVELARALGVGAGGTLSLQATTKKGQQNALDLDVVGTIDNANAFESKRYVTVPLVYAQSLLRMPGRVTEWAIRVDDRDAVDRVAAELERVLGGDFDVQTWHELQPNLADIIRFQQVVIGIIAAVFLVIVVFGVVNTMVMSVLERKREIGTMMALGVRRHRISLLFLFEAAILALLGAVGGAAVARLVVMGVEATGGPAVSAPGSDNARFHLLPVIPPGIVTLSVAAAIVGAVLAALYPAWKAARLRPVEALRSV